MDLEERIFQRTELLLGEKYIRDAKNARVIIFGVGGVGSWCAESLIRSGIGHLTMVDIDNVDVTNINRQLPATMDVIGNPKVKILEERFSKINPATEIVVHQKLYDKDTSASFGLETYDYIIDAIDSLENKIHLIQAATRTNAVFFSSMGAALKIDPTKVQVSEFWKVKGCPLARVVRQRLKDREKPAKKFLCVYSEELIRNRGEMKYMDSAICSYPKGQPNGTVSHITAIFGFTLAGLVVQDICNREEGK